MRPTSRQRLTSAALAGFGAVAGLVVALIVTLNVHIWAGLEQGYAASPAEVFDESVLLGTLDVVLVVVAPLLGAVTLLWLRRTHGGPDRGGGPGRGSPAARTRR